MELPTSQVRNASHAVEPPDPFDQSDLSTNHNSSRMILMDRSGSSESSSLELSLGSRLTFSCGFGGR